VETKQSVDALRSELHKRQQTEEALRSAIDELRVNGEQTMDELKIMTDALRKELERRKRAEEELRAIHERVARAVVAPKAPAESEIVSTSMPPQRKSRRLKPRKPRSRAWRSKPPPASRKKNVRPHRSRSVPPRSSRISLPRSQRNRHLPRV